MLRYHQLEQTWADVQRHLRLTVPGSAYNTWLEPLRPVALHNSTLYLQVPDSIHSWVHRRFGLALAGAAASTTPPIRQVHLITNADNLPVTSRSGAMPPTRCSGDIRLKSRYTFEHFVIGDTNRFAHAAALAVAEMPGQAYNPLFIYGAAGLGKTHLLQAIGNYIATHGAGLSVHYTTAENFTNRFMNALQRSDLATFKRDHREHDVVLLDDVQFLEDKPKTAEELFHTFDALSYAGAQIVVASDRPPVAMPQLAAQLRDRFQQGLAVDVHAPDLSTRRAILEKQLQRDRGQVEEPAVLDYIATRITSNVRILEGALIRATAFAALTQRPLTVNVAEHVLATLPPTEHTATNETDLAAITISRIQKATSVALHLVPTDLTSSKRSRSIVYARQVAMYLARELTELSLPAIARHFGSRHHTTVLHAHRKISRQLQQDNGSYVLINELRTACRR